MIAYGEAPGWKPERPRFRLGQLVLGWLLGAVALLVATKLVPGASDSTFRTALAVAALVALFNAVLPPLVAALRLPFTALLAGHGGADAVPAAVLASAAAWLTMAALDRRTAVA